MTHLLTPLPLADGLADLLPLAVILVCLLFLLRRSYRYFGRRKRSRPRIERLPRPQRAATGSPADAPPQVLQWEVHVYERARELSARIDSKMRALDALIRSARREAQRLESLLERAEEQDALTRR